MSSYELTAMGLSPLSLEDGLQNPRGQPRLQCVANVHIAFADQAERIQALGATPWNLPSILFLVYKKAP